MTALQADWPEHIPSLEGSSQASRSHQAYIERRMERGEWARNVARDLWFWLNRVLDDLRYPCDDDRAAQLARQLCYLCSHYNTETESDSYQGRSTRHA